MASKKKVKKKRVRKGYRKDDIAVFGEFLHDLLDGALGACVRLYESRNGQGDLEPEYDEEVDA